MEDQLNSLYTSKSAEDVLRFYDHFNSADKLCSWMRKRAYAKRTLHGQKGDSEIVIVIPTANYKNEYSNYCKKFYKGFQIVFVESSGPYFSFARSFNLGVERALDFKPRWIIVSNDDVFAKDRLSVLRNELRNVRESTKVVYTRPDEHSTPINCSLVNTDSPLLGAFYKARGGINGKVWELNRKFRAKYSAYVTDPFVANGEKLKDRLITSVFHSAARFTLEGAFVIVNSDLAKEKKGKLYDEAYINSYEDVEFSYNTFKNRGDYEFINFNLGVKTASTLGQDNLLWLRTQANKIYFNNKYRKELGSL